MIKKLLVLAICSFGVPFGGSVLALADPSPAQVQIDRAPLANGQPGNVCVNINSSQPGCNPIGTITPDGFYRARDSALINGQVPAPSATIDTTNPVNIPALAFTRQTPAAYIPGYHFSPFQFQFRTAEGATYIRDTTNGSGPNAQKDADGNWWAISLTSEVNPRWFGALGNYSTNDIAAFNSAAQWASLRNLPLHVTAGNYVLDGGQVVLGNAAIHADGEDVVNFFTHSRAGSLFLISTTDKQIFGNRYTGFTCTNGVSAGDSNFYGSSCIEVAGTKYFEFNTFDHITYKGFEKGEFLSIADGQYDFNKHDYVSVQPVANTTLYAIHMLNGSGTSNIFTHMQGNFGPNISTKSAYLRVDGSTAGDLQLSVSELDGARSLLSVGNSVTVYFDNITLSVNQFDGAMVCPIQVDAGGNGLVPAGVHIAGSNIGGGVTISQCLNRPIKESVIHDRGASEWKAGVALDNFLVNAGQTAYINLFNVELGPYDGLSFDLTIAGSIPNVGGASTRYSCAVLIDGSSPVANCNSLNADSGSTTPRKFTLLPTVLGKTLLLTTSMAVPGSSGTAGGSVHAVISATGGAFRLQRCTTNATQAPSSSC